MDNSNLTHLDQHGNVKMVDVTNKEITAREVLASGKIYISKNTFKQIEDNSIKKGDIFATSRIAGIMGAKKTSDLIPMCHNILLSSIRIDFVKNEEKGYIEVLASLKCSYKTGIEMEALTATSISLLTLYDMLKAIDKSMKIGEIVLLKKTGGKSGDYLRQNKV